ncbi:MAG: hypothetical protein H6581_06330 [Bacteroidia bacterium]|nr:hypothetical protein [Bacteroidia bacterium]
MQSEAIAERMDEVRQALRHLRGRNLFRGTDLYLLPKKQVRLQAEARGAARHSGEVVIHLTETELELWAEEVPGSRKFYLKDYEMNLERFLEAILEVVRGNSYLHTNSQSADYRKK